MASDKGAICTEAKVGVPREFCRLYSLRQTAQFAISKFGHVNAMELSLEWCRRMQHFFDIWRLQGSKSYIFSADELGSYVAQPSWTSLCASIPMGSGGRERFDFLSALRPVNP